MAWRDLLKTQDESFVAPWVHGRQLRTWSRAFTLDGPLPGERGWYEFAVSSGRKARLAAASPPDDTRLRELVCGYLVGDRFVPDGVRVASTGELVRFEQVFLLEPGLDRFERIRAGRPHAGGPLVFAGIEFPLGPEPAVQEAFLEQRGSVDDIPGVPPALDAAFRFESSRRDEAERCRRAEFERQRLEAERQARAVRRRELVEQFGDAARRRARALHDFGEAARAALAVGGASYLDHRDAAARDEVVVRFRMDRRRFECVCDRRTLRIIDAGICLTDESTGERGDTYFTLESLPGVIREADREGSLVVFRHA